MVCHLSESAWARLGESIELRYLPWALRRLIHAQRRERVTPSPHQIAQGTVLLLSSSSISCSPSSRATAPSRTKKGSGRSRLTIGLQHIMHGKAKVQAFGSG